MSTPQVQSQPGPQKSRGSGGRRGGSRGRGGNKDSRGGGGGGRRNNAPQQKVEAAEVVEAPAVKEETAVEPSDAGDLEVCWICAEPVKYYSVSQCNHRTCHVCALRLRALYKRNDCTFCKEPQNSVIFTASPDALFDSFDLDSMPHKDTKLSITFETQDIMEETLILLRFNCPDPACDYLGNGWGDLKLHVRATHGRVLCDLCIRFKKVFAHEHVLYPPNVLPIHLPSMHQRGNKSISPDKVEGGVHPLCEFCRECFFSSDELYPHMRERHEECFICKRNEVRDQYFQNYEQLEKHFNTVHFPCRQAECQAKKFVVFNSALDLKAHMVEEHGGDMSARDRKDARRIQADFTFEEPRAAAPRRGGQQQAQPAPPAAGPSQSRASGSGDRRRAAFGGSLTAAQPSQAAQSSARSTPGASRSSTPPSDSAADPAILERHAVFMSRLEALSGNSPNAVPAVRAAARGYKTSENSARDFISTVWNVLDHNLDSTASIVNAFVDLLDEEDKKQDLLASWKGFVIEQRRQFPDLVPTAVGSGYSNITSGRVLNAKNSTAARSSQQSSRQVLDRVARIAGSSSTATAAIVGSSSSSSSATATRPPERFPPLSSAAPSTSSGFRQGQRTTPWSAAATSAARGGAVDVKAKSSTRPAVSSGQRPPPPKLSNAAFPELPSAGVSRAPRPMVSGNQSLRNILGTTNAPQGSAWSGEGTGGSNEGSGVDGEGEAQAAPPAGGKSKKKGKQKQTLFTLGTFPN
ncbi:hypothetical protein D9611_013777 [Ephemerocybe angulata]|uniref:RING-type E3 ubiquitin transferase n=1 Tax=Ephemerocybe angulata TaxID=980116 RepID=A0A8H5FF52_9AGAR|nr:hypothetical protein D9611_013777 [Tulosesus angulatus]